MAGRQDTKLESEGAEFLVLGNLLIAVSYTHLDVYKRQLKVLGLWVKPEPKRFSR